MKKSIGILSTGGTIEKSYDEDRGELKNRESMVALKLIPRLRYPHLNVNCEIIMAKDSLDMTDTDRKFILSEIQKRIPLHQGLIVIHGTDTMTTTAELVYESLRPPPLPIVFTGAMKPLEMQDSDALQNFTEAVAMVQILDPGVYVSFHGQIFAVPKVRKNKEKRTFEGIR